VETRRRDALLGGAAAGVIGGQVWRNRDVVVDRWLERSEKLLLELGVGLLSSQAAEVVPFFPSQKLSKSLETWERYCGAAAVWWPSLVAEQAGL